MVKLLTVQTEYFTAQAAFLKSDNIWTCIEADSVIEWMLSMKPDQVKVALLKMECTYSWSGPLKHVAQRQHDSPAR